MSCTQSDEQIPFPTIERSLLSSDQVVELTRQISTFGEILEVRTKGHPQHHSPEEAQPISLEAATSSLVEGAVFGVQTRYLFDGQVWSDTVLRKGELFEVVRMVTHVGEGR
ncbi:MAG: hypothetical protein KC561_15600 [Myxococcales bacterium]|nr:hypothetical protein [Myxococcales bacterium]